MSSEQVQQPHPHDQRILAREATYPNTYTEREAVAAIDSAVFERVRSMENHIVDDAKHFMDERDVDFRASTEIANALIEEVRGALSQGARPTPALAARYKQLVASAERAITALEAGGTEAAWHAARAADPYATWADLLQRWPTLRRPL